MNIALVCSPDWIQYVAVEVYAILKNNPPPVTIYVISDRLSNRSMDHLLNLTKAFGKGYSCGFIDMSNLFDKEIPSKINVDGRFTKYALYRLLLPEVLHFVDRLLYIDTDAIVAGDITELYNTFLEDNIIAGVTDIGIGPYLHYSGLTPKDNYINAGVTLMDMKKIRELNLQKWWIEQINSKWYPCHDQDLFNMSCRGKIKLLPLKWNVSLSTGLDIPVDDIRIMHYAGAKPWNTIDVPNYEIWRKWRNEYDRVVGV